MNRREFLFASAAALPAAGAASNAPVPLGKLDRFWRYSPALGPFHEGGQGLLEIPPEMSGGDFPYLRRPRATKEVPFADHLSLVRLLGGFNDGADKGKPDPAVRERDLAYRGADGRIGYRMELLRPRLQPYLENGYDSFTFVLDNVPWCFPEKPKAVGLGQHQIPRDPKEWRAFVEVVCRELVKILGPELAARQRFRVGTENNGRERFDGTHQQYELHYENSVAAVRAVIPKARIGFFNISGISHGGVAKHNVNAYALAERCYREANRADGLSPTPIDFISYSRYFRPTEDPEWHAKTCLDVWTEFGRRVPQLAKASREIHEFGVAPWGEVAKGVIARAETGAMGGALTAQMMWRLKEAGIDRLWHWGPFDSAIRARTGEMVTLPTGTVWLMSVLEKMAGGEAFLFPALERSAAGTQYVAAGSFRPEGSLLMVSAYHRDIARHDPETVRFHIPASLLKSLPANVRQVRLTRETSVHERIRREFVEAGLLEETFVKNPDFLGTVRQMAKSREGEWLAASRRADYWKQWERSLTLRPLPAGAGSVGSGAGGHTVSLRMAPPEVAVLAL